MQKLIRVSIAAACVLTALSPAAAGQRHNTGQRSDGTIAQRQENTRAAAGLRVRMDAVDARIASAVRTKAIVSGKAATLRRQVAQVRRSMAQLTAKQGFVSAAEIASYERTLGAIDVELDRNGVARSYGDDMLPAPRR